MKNRIKMEEQKFGENRFDRENKVNKHLKSCSSLPFSVISVYHSHVSECDNSFEGRSISSL